ncbi:MAG: ACP S-malonyltransferase [Christensenellales bacterium]|jgi:[acyl-carrier-protein] S-malonyltransferase
MAKIAFVFPGQGAQKPGMGKAAYDALPDVRAHLDSLEALRPGTLEMCFSGEPDALSETKHTQPCLFAVETALAAALEARGVRAQAYAGFSLGELTALAASGAVTHAEGFRLVSLRGALMQREAETVAGAMAAILKLSNAAVEALCRENGEIFAVNYNCPGQIVVSGKQSAMPNFLAAVKAAGGRAVPLKVRGAFHTPYMEQAARAFKAALQDTPFGAPKAAIYANLTGQPYAGDFIETLANQIMRPVRWQSAVEHMLFNGFDTFVEIGPGTTLSGLIAKIQPGARTIAVEDAQSIERAVNELC